MTTSSSYRAIYDDVRRIPRGSVATYGQIARLAGLGDQARQVGYALHALPPASRVPWHRVVNARGQVSRRSEVGADLDQRLRLEAEGVSFDPRGCIDLERRSWNPSKVGVLVAH